MRVSRFLAFSGWGDSRGQRFQSRKRASVACIQRPRFRIFFLSPSQPPARDEQQGEADGYDNGQAPADDFRAGRTIRFNVVRIGHIETGTAFLTLQHGHLFGFFQVNP